MKRTLSRCLTLALVLILTACTSPAGQGGGSSSPALDTSLSASDTPETPPSSQLEDSAPVESEGSAETGETKILIAYFSATNNTEGIANHLESILDADLYEIVPETPYTSDDLNYSDSSSRSSQEMNDPDARPAISGSVDNMEQYDVIFLGYPIWWGEAPRIVSTFLEGYDLEGKTIVPFCTSGSSGIGSSAENLHSLAASAAWLDGRRFSGGTSRETVEDWVNGLNLTGQQPKENPAD